MSKSGDTAALINELSGHLSGDIKIISHEDDISPCVDCRYCWKNAGCAVRDEMHDVYKFAEECDNVVLASPIWFSSLSGPLLNLASRIQAVFAAKHFRNESLIEKKKKGAIIIVGAQPETKDAPIKSAAVIMRNFNVDIADTHIIYSLNTDRLPAKDDEAALAKCRETAEILNRRSRM